MSEPANLWLFKLHILNLVYFKYTNAILNVNDLELFKLKKNITIFVWCCGSVPLTRT